MTLAKTSFHNDLTGSVRATVTVIISFSLLLSVQRYRNVFVRNFLD